MIKDETMKSNQWLISWTVIFGLNLMIPLMFGWGMCDSNGKIGLMLAVALCWGVGVVGLTGERRWGRALAYGGIPVGFSQFFPFAQIYAGIIAIKVYDRLSGGGEAPVQDLPRGPLSGPGGFVVTCLTGGLLMTAAFALGWIINMIFTPPASKTKPKPVFSDEF